MDHVKVKKVKRRKNSGQILLIAAFIIASLLLSAELYVLDVGKTTSETQADFLNDFILAIKLGSNHVITGSLANISNGGQTSILDENLRRWSSFVGNQYHLGKNALSYNLMENALYSSGVWTYWGISGFGVSSAYTNFTYQLSNREVEVNQIYSINVTTTLTIESTYQALTGNQKQVNIIINVLNEASPAFAKQVTVYYKWTETWLASNTTDDYILLDYGNGTYVGSFQADIPSDTVEVSVHVVDQREIYLQANATSTQI